MDIIPAKNNDIISKLDTDSLITEWLDYEQKSNGASQNTINTYKRSMSIFLNWLNIGLEFVTPVDVVNFKSELSQNYSAQTVNLHLTAVRSFYRFCIARGYTLINPASDIKGVKRSKSKIHKRDALTNGEVANVLKQPDTSTLKGLRDKAILILLSHCALRSIEIHRADIEDLRTRGDRLTLDVQGKGRIEKDEYVIIPISQEPVIREYLKQRMKSGNGALFISLSNRSKKQRIDLTSIRKIVKGYYGSAGVVGNKKTTHSLRHSAITNAIRKGASPMQVQAMARHSSFDTTLNYFHQTSRLDNPAEDVISYE